MPSRLTRRELLKLAGAGGLGIALAPLVPTRLAAAVPPANPSRFRFIHFTDIHVQPELDAAKGYAQCIDHLNKQDAAFAISGGDLVFDVLGANRSRADLLWKLYTAHTASLNIPVHEVIGNHDCFALANSKVPSSDSEYGKKIYLERLKLTRSYRSFDHGGWHFVLLDSILPKPGGWEPRLDESQLEWLKAGLAASKAKPSIVVLHVPVVTFFSEVLVGSKAAQAQTTVMQDADELMRLFETHNVKLVLQGHVHIREHYQRNGVHYITSGAVCGNWWRGPRMGTPEGYATVDIDGEAFRWTYHTYGWVAKSHQ